MTFEAIRHHTIRVLLLFVALGALAAAIVLALTPSAYTPPPLTRYDVQQQPFDTTLEDHTITPPTTTDQPGWATLILDLLA